TINATAMWLLALYVALARERGVDESQLTGTTQNDLVKEYLARGTYIFPPEHSQRIIAEMYEYCLERIPKWNPSNICSYHLQEAAATPAQELAFALANAISLLDLLKERGHFDEQQFEQAVGRISFFVNSGIRFVEEMCKMRAFGELWDEYTRDRFGVKDEKYRRFRYGVQVNSLGLTESQPENNAWRILIEALGVTLSRDARARAIQLPATGIAAERSEEHTSELQSRENLVCRLLLEKKNQGTSAPARQRGQCSRTRLRLRARRHIAQCPNQRPRRRIALARPSSCRARAR